jgi:hypothetical protein
MRKARGEAQGLAAGFRCHDTKPRGDYDRQQSKYSSNSWGVGRSRIGSSSLDRL